MYIEKNGYVLMNKMSMEFLVDGFEDFRDTDGDIDSAYIYDNLNDAQEDCDSFNAELTENGDIDEDIFEVIRYQKTIWLDKVYQEHIKTVLDTECCNEACCCYKNSEKENKNE